MRNNVGSITGPVVDLGRRPASVVFFLTSGMSESVDGGGLILGIFESRLRRAGAWMLLSNHWVSDV